MIIIASLKDIICTGVIRCLNKIYASEFIGKLTGNADTATKATQDESGNNIKSSYASSISISDHTITLKNKNGTSLGTVTVPDNNTWRGIQNNLTSDSTTDSLSAAQGKVLKGLVDGKLDKFTSGGIASCSGGGKYYYFKIATIKINNAYINRPIVFEMSGRGKGLSLVTIEFSNVNSTDPTLLFFTSNYDNCFWIKKTTTSTWEVYGQYSESYGDYAIHRITGAGANIGVTVTVNMTNIDSLPSGCTQVTYGGNVNYANSSTSATKAIQDSNGKVIADKYVSIYNSANNGGNDTVTVNDLALQGSAVGMINSATDNPTGSNSWVHVWSQSWTKGANNSWVSQIALGTQNGTGMWYRANSGTAVGRAWTRVLDSSNYSSYTVTKTGSGASGSWGISVTGSSASCTGNAATATKLATSRTFTIGNTSRSFDGSGNVSWTLAEIGAAATGHNHNGVYVYDKADVSGTMNNAARYRNAMGMINLSGTDTTVNPNGQTGWHHFINMSYSQQSGSNMWQTQIANKAGTTDLWIRSRGGGTVVDGTAWVAPWTRILTGSNWKNVITLSTLGAAASSHTHSYLPLSGGTVAGNLTVNGTFKANNIITGTKPLTISSASALASISLTSKDLGFTPSVNTSIVATVRKECAPTTLYLNTYTTFYNGTLYVCITNGSSTSTTVPTGTYHIDYIITNNT